MSATTLQLSVLRFIKRYMKKHSISPTMREISTAFNWSSSNSARGHVRRLREHGLLNFQDGRHRSITL